MADSQYQVGGSWGLGDGYRLGEEYGYAGIDQGTTPDQLVYQGPFGKDIAGGIGNNVKNEIAADYSSPAGLMAGVNGAGSNGLIVPNVNATSIGGADMGAWGAGANALGTAASIYNNSSTDTGSSVLSGAASGAAAGTMIMPGIGTAIGAVIGGIIGFFGSKSKKNKEKKAFQQQEQLAVLPERQRQADYLQNQGLLQKAISNYKSGYTPGGFQYKNSLMGGPTSSFGVPTQPAQLPDFNVAPPNVVPGGGDKNYGIAPQSNPNSGVPQNNSGLGMSGLVAPATTIKQPAPINAQAPGYTGHKAQDQADISAYQKNYAMMINQQNAQAAAAAMDPYKAFFMNNGGPQNG